MGQIVGVGLLQDFFKSVVLSAKVKGCEPLSAMLIAEPERGKTSIVLEKPTEAVCVLTDVTGRGLQILCTMNPKMTHIAVNDMAVVMSHGQKTREYFFSILLAMMEEGIRAVATPGGLESVTGGRRGFIGCITSNQAQDNRHWWYKRGVARRMIPFHYDYPEHLVLSIKSKIDKGESADFSGKNATEFKVPDAMVNVRISEKSAKYIRYLSDAKAQIMGQLGISMLKHYRALACGHALARSWKNAQVTDEDVDFLNEISPYVDWQVATKL